MAAEIVSAPFTGNHTIFLSGPPGAGKTTLAVQRLRYLLAQGIPAEQILILVPQRTLATPYYEALASAGRSGRRHRWTWRPWAAWPGAPSNCSGPWWPEPAGFAQPDHPPRFLTLETAQYYMDRIVEPFVSRRRL